MPRGNAAAVFISEEMLPVIVNSEAVLKRDEQVYLRVCPPPDAWFNIAPFRPRPAGLGHNAKQIVVYGTLEAVSSLGENWTKYHPKFQKKLAENYTGSKALTSSCNQQQQSVLNLHPLALE